MLTKDVEIAEISFGPSLGPNLLPDCVLIAVEGGFYRQGLCFRNHTAFLTQPLQRIRFRFVSTQRRDCDDEPTTRFS